MTYQNDDERINRATGEITHFCPVDPGDISLGQVDDLPPDVPTVPETAQWVGDPSLIVPPPREGIFIPPDWNEVLESGEQSLTGRMHDIWLKWKDCTACPLAQNRGKFVLGAGNSIDPIYALWGEGPGANEDQMGVPFVGVTGQLLSQALDTVGIHRTRECYIGNSVCCWPPGNRNPERTEILACRARLGEQLAYLLGLGSVKVVVAIGKPAFVTLTMGKKLQKENFRIDSVPIGKNLGWLPSHFLPPGWPQVYTVYHPSYIRRQGHKPGEWKAFLADWEAIKRYADSGLKLHPRKK